jgi:hypothetical protein
MNHTASVLSDQFLQMSGFIFFIDLNKFNLPANL